VYTFGSNSYGQLGVGDLSSRGSPNLVKMPCAVNISMIAAGSHHTVVLTTDGDVLTWGAHLVNKKNKNSFTIRLNIDVFFLIHYFLITERTIS
jgi:alpha-tubulin suppressor-like RCC1 family protein